MDVNKIKAALSLGMVYDGMDKELQNLHDAGVISTEEYYSLLGKFTQIENENNRNSDTLAVSQDSYVREENNKSKEEDSQLNSVFENPFTSTSTDESATDTTSTEESEEEQSASSSEENTGKKTEEWVSNYHTYMMEWSARNPERRLEKFEAEESSFIAEFKDGVSLNFSSPSNVAVKAADPDAPKASDFDALMEIAKKSNQNIRLSENMSDEFRNALIEACATADVKITNLSKEDAELYLSFVANNEETTEQQDVVNDVAENDTAPVQEEPENSSSEDTENHVEEVENVDDSSVETPAEDDSHVEEPETEDVFVPSSEEVTEMLASLKSEEKNSVVSDNLENADTIESLEDATPTDSLEDAAPEEVSSNNLHEKVDQDAPQKIDLPSEEENSDNTISVEAQEKTVLNRLRGIAPVVIGFGVEAVLAAGCTGYNGKNQKTDNPNTDNVEAVVDSANVFPSPNDESTVSWQQACDTVPTKWNSSMGITEERFPSMVEWYGENWENAYKQANKIKDTFGIKTTEAFLSSFMAVASITSNKDKNNHAVFGTGNFGQYVLDLSKYLYCNEELNVEYRANEKLLLASGNTPEGDMLIAPLIEMNSRYANLLNDGTKLILTKCYRAVTTHTCGSDYDIDYEPVNCGCGQKVTQTIQVVLAPDTVQEPVVDTTAYVAPQEPVAVVDTTQTPPPAPKVKKAKKKTYEEQVWVRTSTSDGDGAIFGFLDDLPNEESGVVSRSKSSLKRNIRRSDFSPEDKEALLEEADNPGASQAKLMEKRRQAQENEEEEVYTYEENDDGNTYNWTVTQPAGRDY